MVNSASHSDYSEKEIEAFDTDDNGAVTDSLYINGNKTVGIYVSANTGSHATHVITTQVSSNGSDWYDTSPAQDVTGIGYIEFDTIAQNVRCKVKTVEGSTSTCNITIASK